MANKFEICFEAANAKTDTGSTPERPYWRAIITTGRGRCYSIVCAGDKPTADQIEDAWHNDRPAFDAYIS